MAQWIPGPRPNVRTVRTDRVVRFRDINCDYGQPNEPLLVEEDKAIQRMFRNLLGTPIGSDELEPLYGSNIPFCLYEQLLPSVGAYMVEVYTIIAIRTWMRGIVSLVYPGTRVVELTADDGYAIFLPYQRVSDGGTSDYNFEILR